MSNLLGTLWGVVRAFDRHNYARQDPAFWLNLIESQVAEARAHLANGDRAKATAELADIHVVSFEAIYRCGEHPTSFIVQRAKAAILPRVDELHESYGEHDGKKGADA
jgi:hypothetical protein